MNIQHSPVQSFMHPFNVSLEKIEGRKLGSQDLLQAGDLISCPHRSEWIPVHASLHGKHLPDFGDEPDSGAFYVRPL